MSSVSLTYRQKFLQNQILYNEKYKKLFDVVADQVAALVNDPNAKFTKSFKFNKPINEKITAFIAQFHDATLALTEQEITDSWNLSNAKNDIVVSNYLKTLTSIKGAEGVTVAVTKYFNPNVNALKAFIARTHGIETLSSTVWNVATQLRGELEIHLGLGLLNGDSANIISQRIRQYLKNPDALFRRVRDKNGNLVASKPMIANAPGQGVYNSAYKNAMRVARTETNRAYLKADNVRWQQLDMVLGVRISLSAQHPDYNYPEICEECEGDYPSDFTFTGWHSQCLCNAVPLMQPEADFLKYLKGGPRDLGRQITDLPNNFIKFTQDNYERFSNYKNLPYWIDDNKNIIEGFVK